MKRKVLLLCLVGVLLLSSVGQAAQIKTWWVKVHDTTAVDSVMPWTMVLTMQNDDPDTYLPWYGDIWLTRRWSWTLGTSGAAGAISGSLSDTESVSQPFYLLIPPGMMGFVQKREVSSTEFYTFLKYRRIQYPDGSWGPEEVIDTSWGYKEITEDHWRAEIGPGIW